MLTREQALKAIEGGRESQCLDGRDYSRLTDFFPVSDYKALGFSLKEGAEIPVIRDWTEEEIKKQLAKDVAFGFEKALNKRGISASFMYEVVKMWMWVLEDELQYSEDYAQYGLPFLKAVAVKYGLPNEIGEKAGNEYEYSSEAD
jgi:hypothetical protein